MTIKSRNKKLTKRKGDFSRINDRDISQNKKL